MSERRELIRVGVNGYGVIGKRVADAVRLQPDMVLVGVADVAADYRIKVAAEQTYAIYAAVPERRADLEVAGIPVAGTLDDLISAVDVIVDCTPKGVPANNLSRYQAAGVKVIVQGGEKHDLAGLSFVAQVNYEAALGKDLARVVSCNTTALCRIADAFQRRGLLKRVRAVLVRRATDPWESHLHGMINTIVPETKVPSHQGPDAQTVIPGLDITTIAAAGPFTVSHIHFAMIETTRPVSSDEARDTLEAAPRIALVRADDGLGALNAMSELMRDLGRPRGDMWEVGVWEDTLGADAREVYLSYQVHNEAIVIPETIDCIRALVGRETNPVRSIGLTDQSLGIVKRFLPASAWQNAELTPVAGQL
ncbi:MAG TPA: type II glyceraldehyde-3-phosphate dehydrogenase [Chloroflexota bacterium]|nr:type II glyceraldehyde-3-phosphate dehydrogenase [Chloroflexota bacterium]